MKILLLGLVLCGFLFVAGFVVPRRSKRIQRRVDRALRKGERESGSSAGRLGDFAQTGLRKVRRGSDRSAAAGRKARKKMPL